METIVMPKFIHPFTMVLSGSTGTGKTEWLMRFLAASSDLIEPPVKNILYCYGETNENTIMLAQHKTLASLHYNQAHASTSGSTTGIITHNGVPSEALIKSESAKSNGRLLLILDDLLVNLRSAFLDPLFTRGSHNWGCSIILVTQHLFSKEIKTARCNAHYLCLMRNPAGELQIRNIALQCFPMQHHYFMDAYRDATQKNFSYLLVDMHPRTDDRLRLRTNLFPGENCVVYIPK